MSTAKFGATLRRLREERKWTQEDLARASGIRRQVISRYEWDGVMPRLGNLQKLADALECSLDLLLTGREPRRPKRSERRNRFHGLVQMLEGEESG